MSELSEVLKERAKWGLNFGAACFGEGDRSPTLVTFGATGKSLQMTNLMSTVGGKGEVEELIELGRSMAADSDAHSYVLWWDALMTFDGKRTDAVLCEAGVRGEPTAFRVALRYKVKDGTLIKIGKPILNGAAEQQLKPVPPTSPRAERAKKPGVQKNDGAAPARRTKPAAFAKDG